MCFSILCARCESKAMDCIYPVQAKRNWLSVPFLSHLLLPHVSPCWCLSTSGWLYLPSQCWLWCLLLRVLPAQQVPRLPLSDDHFPGWTCFSASRHSQKLRPLQVFMHQQRELPRGSKAVSLQLERASKIRSLPETPCLCASIGTICGA